MAKKKLIKRNYLGKGYLHVFEDGDKKKVTVECTQADYEALAGVNPTNPTLAGHTWIFSEGGTVKVDTPNTRLGDNEYCDFEGEYYYIALNEFGQRGSGKIEKSKIINDEIDELDIK